MSKPQKAVLFVSVAFILTWLVILNEEENSHEKRLLSLEQIAEFVEVRTSTTNYTVVTNVTVTHWVK